MLIFYSEKTTTQTFVCLAEEDQNLVPTKTEKLQIRSNGLGEKKNLTPSTGNMETIKTVLHEQVREL